MCTFNGTWASFDEAQRGSLEPGKVADMVVLSENPYSMVPSELSRLKVEKLYLQGRPYESQRQSFVATVVKGLVSRAKV